jgi:hypothetical protein
LRVLTTLSLDKLKVHLSAKPLDATKDFEALVSECGLEFVELDIGLGADDGVQLVGSKNQPISEEISNVKILWNSIGRISSLIALDERFWVTLTLAQHQKYFLSRWFDKTGDLDKARTSLDNHLFATSSRRFIRDQALSRLWWAAKIAHDLPGIDPNVALDTMFWNSDLLSQITTRPGTASSNELTSEILLLMHDRKLDKPDYARDPFREFMKQVDITLGRNVVFSLPTEVLRKRVAEIGKRTLD